ncbi:MFS transporter [Salinicola sp. V024]|uniref:MFS transporter n=1 Tax=Salinicola sp. V024 TaxID=3459609 RepID=UPI004044D155
MTTPDTQFSTPEPPTPSLWVAVFSLTMGVFSLVMAEFLPASLLTPMADSLGSYLGDMIGWRNVFLLATALSVVTLVLQYFTLPRMEPGRPTPLGTLVSVMKRPGMAAGIVAILLVFCGHFAFFTYVRPFLEGVSRMGINELSSTLLAFGVANFVGTLAAGYLLERSLRLTLLMMPLIMGVMGWLLATLGGFSMTTDAIMVALWGFAFGAVPVAWSTWITRIVPDEAESGGGLIVASIQLAIALGAAVGGVMFDISGVLGVCATAGTLLLAASALILVAVRTRPEAAADRDAVATSCQ